MQLLAVLVALGALLDTCPTPSMAQSRRDRLPRPSQPSGSRGGSQSSPAPGMPALGPPPLELTCGDAADFVIVGGGTSGCVLAARICENLPDASVVVLERGAPRTAAEDLLVQSPNQISKVWTNARLTEAWSTLPNPGLDGRTLPQLTGNTLGGTSAINAAQWTKPPLSTFDKDIWNFTGAVLPSTAQHPHLPSLYQCVTRRKQHRPGIASNNNTTHVATARSSADLTKRNQTPTRYTLAKGTTILQTDTCHAASSQRTHLYQCVLHPIYQGQGI